MVLNLRPGTKVRTYLQPAVNRQPGYRRGDREVVGRGNIIFSSKKIFVSSQNFSRFSWSLCI